MTDNLRSRSLRCRWPLRWAVRRTTYDAEKIREILASDPDAVFRADKGGNLPLHYACRYRRGRTAQERLEIVQLLVDAHPGALLERSKAEGSMPVHDAIRYGAHPEVIEYLINRCPQAVEWITSDGPLLHLAAKLGRTDLIECLIRIFPQGLERKNIHGLLPLHIAVQNHRKPEVLELLERMGPQWSTSLHGAAMFGWELDSLRSLAESNPRAIAVKDDQGRLPVHVAAMRSPTVPGVVQWLADQSPASLQTKDDHGQTPLHGAAQYGSLEVVTCLLDRCSEAARERDNIGQTPLHRAARHSSVDIVALLLDRCPEAARVWNNNGQTPLHVAANIRPLRGEIVACLVDRCPEVARERDKNGHTPLHLVTRGHTQDVGVVTCLLDRCPEAARVRDNNGQTPLHFIALHGSNPVMRFLLERCPEAAMERNNYGQVPLHLAVLSRCYSTTQLLVNRCPLSVAVKDNDGRNSLHAAATIKVVNTTYQTDGEWCHIVQFLVDWCSPALLLENDSTGRVPLDLAIQNNAPRDVVEALVVRCPQALQIKDSEGNLLLHRVVAANNGHCPYLEVLVRGFPNALLCKNDAGWIPLHLALQHGSVCRYDVQSLVNQCPESLRVTATRDGRLALHIAAAHSVALRASREVLRYLADSDPEALTVKDHRGWLPLHVAAQNAELDAVQYLVSASPRSVLTTTTHEGWLALHVASQYAKLDVVQFLVSESPRLVLEATTNDGWLAVHVAAKRGDLHVIQCLVEHGGHELLRQPTRREGWLPYHVAAVHDAPLTVVYYLLRTLPPHLG